MQTILGAGGAIAQLLAKDLTSYTTNIRIVSRTPARINPGDELLAADLTRYEEVLTAVKGSEIVYLTVGIAYRTKLWREQWPLMMKNVTAACLQEKCKLVFFDNIYAYDSHDLHDMRETHSIHPTSEKGKIRAQVVGLFQEAVDQGLTGLIARSADFYGPSIKGASVLTETVFKPLSQGKKANWMISDTKRHAYTYTPDASRAVALLGNTPDAFGQTWHLPTAPDALTGKDWVELIARELGVPPKYRVVSKGMARLLGIFVPDIRESIEMLYQFEQDYGFNSEKFTRRFGILPTPYVEGIRQIIAADYAKK